MKNNREEKGRTHAFACPCTEHFVSGRRGQGSPLGHPRGKSCWLEGGAHGLFCMHPCCLGILNHVNASFIQTKNNNSKETWGASHRSLCVLVTEGPEATAPQDAPQQHRSCAKDVGRRGLLDVREARAQPRGGRGSGPAAKRRLRKQRPHNWGHRPLGVRTGTRARGVTPGLGGCLGPGVWPGVRTGRLRPGEQTVQLTPSLSARGSPRSWCRFCVESP